MDQVGDGKILYNLCGVVMRTLDQKPTNAEVLKSLGNPKSDEMKSRCTEFGMFLPMFHAVAINWDQGTYKDYLGGRVFDKLGNRGPWAQSCDMSSTPWERRLQRR